jgi:glutamate 5-kinase
MGEDVMNKVKRIGIKLGSSLLVDGQGQVDEALIGSICRQVAHLVKKKGCEVFIVTSGAIASDPNSHRSKNLRSAIGQSRIMNCYARHLEGCGIEGAQFLLTDDHLKGVHARLIKRVLLEAFRERVVPIINANDVVDSAEIRALRRCADNDKMLNAVCVLIDADAAIIGFNKAGVEVSGNVISVVSQQNVQQVLASAKGGSALGHGPNGMRTKVRMLTAMAKRVMFVALVPGREPGCIIRGLAKEDSFGTRFAF